MIYLLYNIKKIFGKISQHVKTWNLHQTLKDVAKTTTLKFKRNPASYFYSKNKRRRSKKKSPSKLILNELLYSLTWGPLLNSDFLHLCFQK